MFLKKILICIAILVCFSSFGEAIKCYHCQADQTSDCLEPEKHQNKLLVDCDTRPKPAFIPNNVVATKCTSYKREVGPGVQPVMVRSCFWETPSMKYADNCMKASLDNTKLMDCKVCDSDLCNSAFSARATIGLVTIMMLIMGIFAY